MSVRVMLIEEGKVLGPFGSVVAVPRVGDHVVWTESVEGPGPEFVVTKVKFVVAEEPKEGGGPLLKDYAEVHLKPVAPETKQVSAVKRWGVTSKKTQR